MRGEGVAPVPQQLLPTHGKMAAEVRRGSRVWLLEHGGKVEGQG